MRGQSSPAAGADPIVNRSQHHAHAPVAPGLHDTKPIPAWGNTLGPSYGQATDPNAARFGYPNHSQPQGINNHSVNSRLGDPPTSGDDPTRLQRGRDDQRFAQFDERCASVQDSRNRTYRSQID